MNKLHKKRKTRCINVYIYKKISDCVKSKSHSDNSLLSRELSFFCLVCNRETNQYMEICEPFLFHKMITYIQKEPSAIQICNRSSEVYNCTMNAYTVGKGRLIIGSIVSIIIVIIYQFTYNNCELFCSVTTNKICQTATKIFFALSLRLRGFSLFLPACEFFISLGFIGPESEKHPFAVIRIVIGRILI